MTIFDMQL